MKLTGNLKAKVEHTGSREEAKKAIEDAGMLLNDDELEQVAGGTGKEESRWCACKKPAYNENNGVSKKLIVFLSKP